MNKNSKQNRNFLKHAKKDITCFRMRTQPGSTQLVTQSFTMPFGTQKRNSEHAKVAAAGCKTPNGPSLIEQMEMFYGDNFIKR